MLLPQGGESCGWNCLIAASSTPQHWYDSVLAQVNYVSGGLALWNVETFGGGPVVDRSSAAYQQGERNMAVAYTLATLGAGVYEQGLQGAVGAQRGTTVFTSPDRLVGELATKIEAAYPGHVVGVNVPVRDASGRILTEVDILLRNVAIQVKSGGGKGLAGQLGRTEQATGLPAIGYGPRLKPSVWRSCTATTCEQTLIDVVRP